MKRRIPLYLRTIENAQYLRKNQTHAEGLLWQALRNRRLDGIKFRRQHPFQQYVLDFFCVEYQFAIEVDGSIHSHPETRDHDAVRNKWIAASGILILRFSNHEIETNLPAVVDAIISTIEKLEVERVRR